MQGAGQRVTDGRNEIVRRGIRQVRPDLLRKPTHD